MARRRFYAPPDNITASSITLSNHETHHLIHVLRMTPGDEAFVFDGCGREYRCSFRRVEGNHAQLEIDAALCDVVESPLHLTLAQSAWVQFAHYLGYFLMALPAGWLASKLGYKGGIIAGLLMVAVGGF